MDGTAEGIGVWEGEGAWTGVEKPERDNLGLADPVADFGRGLRANEGSELDGICHPPSFAWSTCIPATHQLPNHVPGIR
jgi:hypothetical protein